MIMVHLSSITLCVAVFLCAFAQTGHANSFPAHVMHGHNNNAGPVARNIANSTIGGTDKGCRHRSRYYINSNAQFDMCMGQTDQDLKNGMSIINLINSRGFLPTCRVMQLMLWMAASVNDRAFVAREHFVDVGANIGNATFYTSFYCYLWQP